MLLAIFKNRRVATSLPSTDGRAQSSFNMIIRNKKEPKTPSTSFPSTKQYAIICRHLIDMQKKLPCVQARQSPPDVGLRTRYNNNNKLSLSASARPQSVFGGDRGALVGVCRSSPHLLPTDGIHEKKSVFPIFCSFCPTKSDLRRLFHHLPPAGRIIHSTEQTIKMDMLAASGPHPLETPDTQCHFWTIATRCTHSSLLYNTNLHCSWSRFV